MADPTPPAPAPSPAPTPAPAPAPGSPPLPAQEPAAPTTVPYDRFKEINDKNKTQEEELQKFRDAEKKRIEAEQLSKGEHEKVIADLRPKAERAQALEKTIQTVVDAEMQLIPKERQSLVPASLPPEEKLAYITANREFLTGKKGNVNHPTNPADGSPAGGDNTIFTSAQINDPVFYAANRDAILKAMKENRIKD